MTEVPFVALRGVSLAYGSGDGATLALERADLELAPGEFCAVVGPSGCGKSTLMRLVSGLMPPTTGVVEIEGKALLRPTATVGMAFQNPNLLPWRTTLDNVLLPMEIVRPHAASFRRDRARHAAAARALLALVGLEGFEDRHPWQLSGGMQMRAALCRALIHEPRLLLLDEPFAALDAFTREDLWQALQDLWAARRFTAIHVTHDLREAVFLADTIAIVSRRPGRIVHRQTVPFARPRPLSLTYTAEFNAVVQELRGRVGEVRAA